MIIAPVPTNSTLYKLLPAEHDGRFGEERGAVFKGNLLTDSVFGCKCVASGARVAATQ